MAMYGSSSYVLILRLLALLLQRQSGLPICAWVFNLVVFNCISQAMCSIYYFKMSCIKFIESMLSYNNIIRFKNSIQKQHRLLPFLISQLYSIKPGSAYTLTDFSPVCTSFNSSFSEYLCSPIQLKCQKAIDFYHNPYRALTFAFPTLLKEFNNFFVELCSLPINSTGKLQLSIIYPQYNNCMDIWNFPTQGLNYQKFRPQYPQELCQQALEPLLKRQKYLDIAVGTGKILLNFCSNFSQTKGIDVSDNMLDVASLNVQKFRQTHPTNSILLQKHHVMDLHQDEKFDLVTVGQALHFFPVQKALHKIKNILNQGGMLMVFGYVLREVHSQNPKENDLFYEFYDMLLPYFTFDMYDLHNHYTDQNKYPFESVFDQVERKQTDLTVEMTKEEYLNYLKTWSAYGLYHSKHGIDPILKLSSVASEKVTCVFDYFRIRCFK